MNGNTRHVFFNHIKENLGHKIHWDKVVFLDFEKNWRRRKIKEAVYINATNPTNELDRKRAMNLEKGYVLDEIWSEFNEVRRQSTKLGMLDDVLIGLFFSVIYLIVLISLWGFQDMLGWKCDTSTKVCNFIICFVCCV